MNRNQTTLSDADINFIISRCIRHTTAYKSGDYRAIIDDNAMVFMQPIIIAAGQSRTKQMEQAFTVSNQCTSADEEYAFTKTSVQVDLNEPSKATIIIREY